MPDDNHLRHRRRLDFNPADDDEDDGITPSPLDEAEDVVWTWLPLAFVVFALVTLGSMYYISSHDHVTSYFHAIHHGPRAPVAGGLREVRLTQDELALFNGVDKKKLYLAILGQVFDVTAGARHYGVNGAYRYFIGVDRSRAFSSGIKSDGEDITYEPTHNELGMHHPHLRSRSLTDSELLSVHKWLSFFANHKEYSRVGTVEGLYYDKYVPKCSSTTANTTTHRFGHAKPIVQTIRSRLREAQVKADAEAAVERCNMQWTAETGATTIWCQDETKYPRAHGDANELCGCFTTAELATENLPLYKSCTEKRCVVA
ncbi:hypothetical protein DYB32_001304 [Aphanomyces invadans]|uniref:Cytochrome b5 heme-binding domain-containing protein n=1 Tax=Aphanomyces invadans TaxID=157072 RepID=A0A418B6W8_9STRA|nr:hypothetical protein DYB32_001304 [Aphanomyces invadans]